MFDAETATRLDSEGWIVGCSIESRSTWMKWVHPFPKKTDDELHETERLRCVKAAAYWADKPFPYTENYLEICKKYPLKENND